MAAPSLASYYDLVAECDNFPYDDDGTVDTFFKFYLPHDTRIHGYITYTTAFRMNWTSKFKVDSSARRISLIAPTTLVDATSDPTAYSEFCTSAIQELIDACREKGGFPQLGSSKSEPYAVPGALAPVSIERFAAPLFGIVLRGAHVTVYTCSPPSGSASTTDASVRKRAREAQYAFYIPRRSAHLKTYPGMLDSSVAGGVRSDMSPWETVVKEADEEASLTADLVTERCIPTGIISYMALETPVGSSNAWSEKLVTPDIIYVYDLDLPQNISPGPNDDEVQSFTRMNTAQVKESLRLREWKPNSAVVMIEFLVRHGLLTTDEESRLVEILSRMHRLLPFPVSAGQ